VLTGAVAFTVATEGGRHVRHARPLAEQIDRIAAAAGLELRQINVTGHRMTPDADIFKALELGSKVSLLALETAAARERIERLPWVERATVERIFPDEVSISLVERKPFALWRKPAGDVLIDDTGRELGPPGRTETAGLPVVSGEGAGPSAPRLLRALAGYPAIASRVALAERVGDRRWTLTLDRGLRIHLPADDEAGGLLHLAAPRRGGRLIDRELSLIDLRSTERIVVRREQTQTSSAAALVP
jgi:cell division protein FtsQ